MGTLFWRLVIGALDCSRNLGVYVSQSVSSGFLHEFLDEFLGIGDQTFRTGNSGFSGIRFWLGILDRHTGQQRALGVSFTFPRSICHSQLLVISLFQKHGSGHHGNRRHFQSIHYGAVLSFDRGSSLVRVFAFASAENGS